jgi:NAD(P)-dependent dehydrogenase (short-subunit alcohol dehydrogenase family)
MVARKSGHVVNISSIGVLTNAPRFSAYVASKAALDAWSRCAASELADRGVTFTTISMPLVRTPMIAPTQLYNNVPTLSPEEAADLVAQACIFKPVRIATRLGQAGEVLHAVLPRVAQIIMNTSFRMFPESSAALGQQPGEPPATTTAPPLTPEALAMQQMLRGFHF